MACPVFDDLNELFHELVNDVFGQGNVTYMNISPLRPTKVGLFLKPIDNISTGISSL